MDILRKGTVSSVDEQKHTARVNFVEVDGEVSFDLPVLVTCSGDYALPPVDALVLCAIEPGQEEVGYVLGVVYNESDAPPLSDKGQRSVKSDDLRLGNPAATKKIALAPDVKSELDKVKTELDNIKTALSTHTHLAGALASPAGAVTGSTAPSADQSYTVGYSPTEPKAQKVSAE